MAGEITAGTAKAATAEATNDGPRRNGLASAVVRVPHPSENRHGNAPFLRGGDLLHEANRGNGTDWQNTTAQVSNAHQDAGDKAIPDEIGSVRGVIDPPLKHRVDDVAARSARHQVQRPAR